MSSINQPFYDWGTYFTVHACDGSESYELVWHSDYENLVAAANAPASSGSAPTVDLSGINATIAGMQADQQTLLTYQTQTFDVGVATSIFGSALLFYWVAKGGGMVLKALRGRDF